MSDNTRQLAWRWADAAVDTAVIDAIGAQFGVRFPDEYIECARVNHGGHPTLKCFDMPGRCEAVFDHLLSLTNSSDTSQNPSMLQVYEMVKDRLVPKVFPFAADPFGNLICFDYRSPSSASPTCVFWDHEKAYRSSEEAITPICKSFGELINSLYLPD